MVLWVFGYGSLVWNPGFNFDEKVIGFIKDFRRVFDLACIDHRGTPEHPARTCTLEFKKGAVCEGEDFQPAVTDVTLFISTPDKIANRYYLGPAPLEEMARTIATANGPCGNNREYLFSLEKAMFHIGHEDAYVIKLANEVRRVLGGLREKKTVGTRFAVIKPKLPLIQLVLLQEAVVMNSR